MTKAKISILAIGLIVVLGAIVYANSLNNPFIWDDENLVVSNPYIKDIRLTKNVFTKDLGYGTQFSNFYRPLQTLSFELDYYLWGLNPFGFHLTNLLLHIACALLIYFLFVQILPAARGVALITALLFLIHPVQTEAVAYISGRADSQASIFMLLSIILYIKQSRKVRPKNMFYLSGAVISFIFALLCKETSLILPLVIILYDVSFSQDNLRFRDKLKVRYSLFLLVALIYILLRATVLNFLHRPLFLTNTTLALRMLTSAKIFTLYFGLLVLPFDLHMERSVPMVSSILDQGVLPSLILLIFLAILIVRSYRHSRVCFFAGIWFFLNLLPVSNIVPLNANMAEHWLYLPSVGFFLLIALGIDKLLKKARLIKGLSIILLITLVCFYSFLTIKRNQEWKDPQSFFQSILYYNPQSTEAHNCLGAIYKSQGKIDLAIDEFKQAVKINPRSFKSYGNLGSALRKKKEYDLAISAYKKALQLRPGIPGLYNNLGNIYADHGEWPKAEQMFVQAIKLFPEFALCRSNLAKVYYGMGKIDLAIEECKKALVLEPNLVTAHYNLAVFYQAQKEYDLAIDEYKRLINIAPGYVPAHLNLGTAYNVTGRLDQAMVQYQRVLELNPSLFHAYHNLGVVYFKKRQYLLARKYFLQALELNPGHEPSKEFLKKLE
jgi:tetratricopeptide (TPR) repeat protein